jgi:hypothetical protein
MEPRVRPGEHAGGLRLIKQVDAHEAPEDGAAERLGQARRVVGGPRDEGAISPDADPVPDCCGGGLVATSCAGP